MSDAGTHDAGRSRARGDAGNALRRDAAVADARAAVDARAADDGQDAGTLDGSAAANARHFALASTGAQLLVTGDATGLQLTAANLSDDVDVVAVHQEFYGLPWDAFENGQDPLPAWMDEMNTLAQRAKDAKRPVFLSVTMLNGGRKTLAARPVLKNGKLDTEDNWAAACYDFASAPDAAAKREAYLGYVRMMVRLFQPRWLNYAVEVNLFFENCPAAAPGLIALANAAYDAAKAEDPSLIAFPSIQIDHLYGYSKDSCADMSQRDQCFSKALSQVEQLTSDRFAMSSYPFLQGQTPADLGDDWFVRAANMLGKRPVIAETGWISADLRAQLGNACQTQVHASEQLAADYLDGVLRAADAHQIELVTWWSNRDLIPTALMTDCPCMLSSTWCSVVDLFRQAGGTTPEAQYLGEILLKAFGTMGIRDYDGVAKPLLMPRWQAARARPLAL
jgi:hypothetical protein